MGTALADAYSHTWGALYPYPLIVERGGVGGGCVGTALADAYSHTWGALYPYLAAAAAVPERRLQVTEANPPIQIPHVSTRVALT